MDRMNQGGSFVELAVHISGWCWRGVCLGALSFGLGCSSDDQAVSAELDREHAVSGDVHDVQTALVQDNEILGTALPPKRLALTYDDGPGRNTLKIAQWLYGEGIPATFFFNGCRFEGAPTPIEEESHQTCLTPHQTIAGRYDPDFIDDIRALGHRVGNHTQDHTHLPALLVDSDWGATEVRRQVTVAHTILAPHIDDELFVLRAPHNDWSAAVAAQVNIAAPQYLGTFKFDVKPLKNSATWNDTDCLDCVQSVINGYFNGVPEPDCKDSQGNLVLQTPESCADSYVAATGTGSGQVDHGIIMLHDREVGAEASGNGEETLDLTKHLVTTLRAQGYVFVHLDAIPGVIGPKQFGPKTVWTTEYSNSQSSTSAPLLPLPPWSEDTSYYSSIRYGDIDDDNGADICGRTVQGLWCAQSNGEDGFIQPKYWLFNQFTDAQGWRAERYGATLQLGDLDEDGDADVCGRGSAGLWCAKSNGTNGFATATVWTSATADFSNAQGWDSASSYYLSIRLGDVDGDGDADACGRHAAGVWCAKSTGSAFAAKTLWLSQDFGDSNGYLPPEHGATLMLGDINGDDRADVCARGRLGIRCGLAKTTGNGFHNTTLWLQGPFSDADGWESDSVKYRSIQLADVNGDGLADVCGRNDTGIVCAFSNGTNKFRNYMHLKNVDFHDIDGWAPAEHGATIRFADINEDGMADVCGRAVSGIKCSAAAEALRVVP